MKKKNSRKQRKLFSPLRKIFTSKKYLALIAIPLAGIGGLLLYRAQAANLYQLCNGGYGYEIPGDGRTYNAPAVVSFQYSGVRPQYQRQVFVAVRGTDQGIHYTTLDWPSKRWYGSWYREPGLGLTVSSPLWFVRKGLDAPYNAIALNVLGTDYNYHSEHLTGSSWSGWYRDAQQPEYINRQTARIYDNTGSYELYAFRSSDNKIWLRCTLI